MRSLERGYDGGGGGYTSVKKEAVVADNTVLSNFALIGRDLAKLFENTLFTTEEVFETLDELI